MGHIANWNNLINFNRTMHPSSWKYKIHRAKVVRAVIKPIVDVIFPYPAAKN
jgi:hypothetical protein